MTLIEVMVALLILSVGVLGAAAVQLNALKYTDSAMRNTQANFIAHDMIERMRANPEADYSLGSLSQAPTSGNLDNPRQQDLFDFAINVKQLAGDGAEGRIFATGEAFTVEIDWNDARGGQQKDHTETFTLCSIVSPDTRDRP